MPEFFANKADFDRAIQEALKPLTEELLATKQNRDTLLVEKRKLEGKTNGITPEGVVRTATELHVPHALVKGNTEKYQYFRKLAQDEGLQMRFLTEEIRKSDEHMPDTFTTDRMHYVSKAFLAQDGNKYRQEKAYAESKGVQMQIVTHATELPAEAFIPKDKP